VLARDGELAAWLRLLATPGVGRETARRLLATCGTSQAIFNTSAAALRQTVSEPVVTELLNEPEGLAAQLDAVNAWLDGDAARGIVTLGDPEYPPALLQSPDPPLLLYVHGRVSLLSAPSVAIVGSRNPTPQGEQNARAFATHLSRAGFTVVSGLALGIDAAAHEGGLAGAGSTVAVVGTGLDRVYPRRNRELAHRIAREGLLVSEFPLGSEPLHQHFPQRNRIIAGLAQGTLVVEAALQSGSLITARLATEAGREVFAIPGSIHAPLSRGCHQLLKDGAKLVESGDDLLEELRPGSAATRPAPPCEPAEEEDPLLQALGHDPATLDALVARTGWPAARLNARLLELELDAQVVRLPGGLFQRRCAA
jgi:DNA processing protein